MRFDEDALRARGNRSHREMRDEFARTATRSPVAKPRTLNTVRCVEYHGCIASVAHSAKRSHVHHQIAVTEKCAALRNGYLGRTTGWSSFAHLFDGATHRFRMKPLTFLYVHRL